MYDILAGKENMESSYLMTKGMDTFHSYYHASNRPVCLQDRPLKRFPC